MNPMISKAKGSVDRISDLPDPILEKILSYVPTKNAVATSILSKRWKHLSPFAALPIVLSLCDSSLIHPNENQSDVPSVSFMEFVDKLLNRTLLSNVHCVEGMSLRCENDYVDAKIVSWVCAALRLNIERLTLSLPPLSDSYGLFVGLNGCTTLVRLVLALDSELCLPDDFTLPNLNYLHLSKVILRDDNDNLIFSDFIDGCPALEDLCLTSCNLGDLENLGIESSRLKNLKIENCFDANLCFFFLRAPSLEVLELNDYVAWDYSVHELSSLITARIKVSPSLEQRNEGYDENHYEDDGSWRFDNDITRLVTACSNTTSLYLAACTIVALCCSSLQIREFQNLTCLSLGCIGLDGWAFLAHLLQKAPNLEQLMMEGFNKEKNGFAKFQKSLPVSPVCLDLCMKRIEVGAFTGDEDEMKLVEYFLKNGDVLQELILDCVSPDDTHILKRLLMMPRQSKTCQIVCRSI